MTIDYGDGHYGEDEVYGGEGASTDPDWCLLPPNQNRVGITQLWLNPTANEEWDLVICGGQLMTISAEEYRAQKVKQLLLTGFGEVQTDVEYGVPWLDEILGVKNPDLGVISSILIDVLEDDETLQNMGLTSVTISDINLSSSRQLSIDNLVVTFTDNENVNLSGLQL